MAHNINTSILDPHVKALLNNFAIKHMPSLNKISIEFVRYFLSESQAHYAGPTIPAIIEDFKIPHGPRSFIPIRIVRPAKTTSEKLPAIIYFHGGGWIWGNKETHDRFIRELANGADSALVFIEYTLAPEGSYPVAHEECYAVISWIAEHGKSINIDSSRLAFAGDSVGGLLATTVALMVKERNGPSIKFQVLFSPVTDSTFDTPSYQEFATGYYLEKEALEWVWNLYAPDKKVREEPFVSPLKASVDQLRGLPPALIITSECDVLRDEGEAYAHKLMQANIPVVATRYLGMIHNFVMINALEHIPSVRLAIAQAVTALKNAFGK
jgi:acetyl esterase